MKQMLLRDDLVIDDAGLKELFEDLSMQVEEPFYERANYLQVSWMQELARRTYMMNHEQSDYEYLKYIKQKAQHYADKHDMPSSFVKDARLMAEDRIFKRRLKKMLELEGLEKERKFMLLAARAETKEEREDLFEILISPDAWERAHS